MFYYSTRDPKKSKKYTSAQIIKQGLADDGGLFIPESIPELTKDEALSLCSDSYPVRAAKGENCAARSMRDIRAWR